MFRVAGSGVLVSGGCGNPAAGPESRRGGRDGLSWKKPPPPRPSAGRSGRCLRTGFRQGFQSGMKTSGSGGSTVFFATAGSGFCHAEVAGFAWSHAESHASCDQRMRSGTDGSPHGFSSWRTMKVASARGIVTHSNLHGLCKILHLPPIPDHGTEWPPVLPGGAF